MTAPAVSRAGRVVLGIAWLCLSSTPAARAQTPIGCPSDADVVTTYEDNYARAGGSFTVSAQPGATDEDGTVLDPDPSRITNLTVTSPTLPSPLLLAPFAGDPLSSEAIIPARSTPGQQSVVFDWDQDVGTLTACHGRDRATVPIVASTAKVGTPEVVRLSGTYRVRSAPYGQPFRGQPRRWTMRPQCDIFGCTTRMRSNGAFGKQTLKIRSGVYRMVRRNAGTSGYCTVRNNLTGETQTAKPAYRYDERLSLRGAGVRSGVAQRLSGTITTIYTSLPKADELGCGTDAETVERVSGRRVAP